MFRLAIQFFIVIYIALHCASSSAATVLFDEAHAQAFTIGKRGKLDLYDFAELISQAGNQVQATRHPITKNSLANIDSLVVSGPFKPFQPSEISVIKDFVHSGGKLVILIHISPTVGALLAAFDIGVSNYVVNEQTQLLNAKSTSFVVSGLTEHALFSGISSFNLYGGWALRSANKNMKTIASTSQNAWLDLNKNQQQDSQDLQLQAEIIVGGKVGQGEVLVFADDAIFQNQFLKDNNKKMAINLAAWLSKSDINIPSSQQTE